MFGKIIFEFHGHGSRSTSNIWIGKEWLGSNHAANSSICTFNSLDNNINLILVLHCHDLVVIKSNSSREILIQNSDFTFGIVTKESFLLLVLRIINLDAEIKVWLPIIIVENLDVKNL